MENEDGGGIMVIADDGVEGDGVDVSDAGEFGETDSEGYAC